MKALALACTIAFVALAGCSAGPDELHQVECIKTPKSEAQVWVCEEGAFTDCWSEKGMGRDNRTKWEWRCRR